jgi:hypothetical protein
MFVNWILGLGAAAGSALSGVVSAATARILAVYNFVVSFLVKVKGVVVGARAAVASWLAAHLAAALATLATLQWLAFTYLPARLAAVQAFILSWAAQRIASALAVAESAITALRTWALQQLVAIAQAINALQTWAVGQFAQAVSRITRIEQYLFKVLDSPDHIAAYIVDAMARALGRWALDNAVTVGRTFVRWFMSGLTGALSLVEDVITRTLFE